MPDAIPHGGHDEVCGFGVRLVQLTVVGYTGGLCVFRFSWLSVIEGSRHHRREV